MRLPKMRDADDMARADAHARLHGARGFAAAMPLRARDDVQAERRYDGADPMTDRMRERYADNGKDPVTVNAPYDSAATATVLPSPVECIDAVISEHADLSEDFEYGSPRWCALSVTVVALFNLRRRLTDGAR